MRAYIRREVYQYGAASERASNEYTLDHLPEDVPVEVVEHRLRSEDLVCPECGSTMAEIGKEVRRKAKLEPAKLTVVEDRYYNHACRKCEQEGIKTPVVKAAGAPPRSYKLKEGMMHCQHSQTFHGVRNSSSTARLMKNHPYVGGESPSMLFCSCKLTSATTAS